ncbi:MAG: ribonuclease R [Phycisphaeraceae bacterium]|nr:ribonuclease R [Phycisphaeraceae bacterium]
MSEHYTERILDYMADRRYEPRGVRDLAAELAIPEDQFDTFRRCLDELVQEGRILRSGGGQVVLPPMGRFVTGSFRRHERGFGFVIPDSPTEHGDLFIPPGDSLDAITGDRVRAKVRKERRSGQASYVGQIVEILQHTDRRYAGTLTRKGSSWLVIVDGKALHDPVIIRDPQARNARAGDKVVIELVDRASGSNQLPTGVITEVLGEAGQPDVETLAVMHAYGLPDQFPEQVVEQARQAAATFKPDQLPPEREDLTNLFICTIDPPDAKDYDDAISIERTDDGGYQLGVHIADVAHFVRPGSALDQEAQQRGNSTYLPRRVIPMLPELLSNGVCSLQEGVNRYAKSCFIRYDGEGNVQDARFARSVIRSAKRLTYLEAQALIDGDLREAIKHVPSGSVPRYPRKLIPTLQLMDELAKVIRKRRLDEGMIVLGLPQVELIFDESGRVIDAVPEDDAFTHTLIEMFMVEANEAAARLFDSLDAAMLRRVHADPDPHDLSELERFTRVAGYNIPARPDRRQLQGLLDAVRGKPAQHAVHLAVLKTLSKAEYAPLLVGHFALASEHYTHFTSPIRRYVDLVVHRGIDAYLDARGGKRRQIKQALRDQLPDEQTLGQIGKHCSATEVNSESAERELRTYLVLELLSDQLGEDFAGTVTGVSGSGAFVELNKYLVDGFVPLEDLPGPPDERWQLNRNTGALVAQRSGKTITIGDTFTVRIARIDLPRRRMELVVVEPPRKQEKKSGRKQSKGAKRAHKQTMKIKQNQRKKRRR